MKTSNQISQTQRVSRSRHTGQPILEELNTVYGYYATVRFLSDEQYRSMLLLPEYSGPTHEAEMRYRANLLLAL